MRVVVITFRQFLVPYEILIIFGVDQKSKMATTTGQI
jgi:hypothetical protein